METSTCAAFDGDIPDNILNGLHDHTKPFKGNHGIMFEPKIDGEVYSFPVYGETDKDNVGIRNLYIKTFGKQPSKDSLYNDVRMAIVYNKPI
ncbi:MAG: hypothetical protein M0P27_01700 [Bacteroidales bacterium]|nr:hypothetical protein [Bacteroidales bacterium]